MALDTLIFEFDPIADHLKVAGVDYATGSFRGICAPLTGVGALLLEARGGGVFQVTVPAAQAKAKTPPPATPTPLPPQVAPKGP